MLRDTWTKIAGSGEELARCQAGVRRDCAFFEQGHTVAVAAVPPVGWRYSSPKALPRLGLTVDCTTLFACCTGLNGNILCCWSSSLLTLLWNMAKIKNLKIVQLNPFKSWFFIFYFFLIWNLNYGQPLQLTSATAAGLGFFNCYLYLFFFMLSIFHNCITQGILISQKNTRYYKSCHRGVRIWGQRYVRKDQEITKQ